MNLYTTKIKCDTNSEYMLTLLWCDYLPRLEPYDP